VYLSRAWSSTRAGTPAGTYRMPVVLDDDGGIDLRIVVDGSVVEVFAGDGHSLTARVYPTSAASIALLAGATGNDGRATVWWWRVRTQDRVTAPTA
jgi:beta-fructofuranosidase